MGFTAPRQNLALAADGGGIRGVMVAQALVALEKELGGRPLIEHPSLKVLAGTSAGTLISGGLALGMTASEVLNLFVTAARDVFPPPVPEWLPAPIQSFLRIVLGLLRPSLYSNDKFKLILRDAIQAKTGNPDFTLGELKTRLRSDQALVITVADVAERRTRFLKSYQEQDADWTLWEAMLASSSAPTFLPVVTRRGRYYIDGGVGSYANPVSIATRELIEWGGYATNQVSIFSFGTGWVGEADFLRATGTPDNWRIYKWATTIPILLLGDAARAKSLDIIVDFILDQPPGQGIDFRRFQIQLQDDIGLDDSRPQTIQQLQRLGEELGRRVLNDQHALGSDPGFDPEGLRSILERYKSGVKRRREMMPKG